MMLLRFRIKNYKSIQDSGWCWMSSDITVLAGKNESGKSAILEALKDFDPNVEKLADGAHPVTDPDAKPSVWACFGLTKDQLEQIAKYLHIKLYSNVLTYLLNNGLIIEKRSNGEYHLSKELNKEFENGRISEFGQELYKGRKALKELRNYSHLRKLVDDAVNNGAPSSIRPLKKVIGDAAGMLGGVDESERADIEEKLSVLKALKENLEEADYVQILTKALPELIPNFILFSDFQDLIPFLVPIDEAKETQAVLDFAKLSGLDLEAFLESEDDLDRRNRLDRHAARLTGDFMGYWKQDKLNLKAEIQNDKLRFGVVEVGKTELFMPEQRSQGFRWFLSFYMRLQAEQDSINIVLIDEPGLYLHAKAQKDVLNVLSDISKKQQVIFSTHSPYLIDVDRLDRIRLVLKNSENGTLIENKIHKNADNETLTPIITAIGLDLRNEFSIANNNNVVLEGITDYYYLQGMRTLLGVESDTYFIPCVGASRVVQMASLLLGWDLSFVALLDNDKAGKDSRKSLLKELSIDETLVKQISTKDKYEIEDLFTRGDFNAHVLKDEKNDDDSVRNSRFIKNKNIDKVLLAKQFCERAKTSPETINLTDTTKKNFKAVFDMIQKTFSPE